MSERSDAREDAPTVKQLLQDATEVLEASAEASDNSGLDAEILLCWCLDCNRSWLYTWPERVLDESAVERFRALIERRRNGVPVAYLTGEREFWSLALKATPDTLIPRPATEALVEQALALPLPARARVLDLGTGTGAVALALAKERLGWEITAVDRVSEAVDLARDNARMLGLEQVAFLVSDWFEGLEEGDWDLIVSNPPYVAENDPHLERGDVRHEPRLALAAGVDGLDAIRAIIAEAGDWLAPEGWLALEHGYDQQLAVADCLRRAGFHDLKLVRDLAGQPRVVAGRGGGR